MKDLEAKRADLDKEIEGYLKELGLLGKLSTSCGRVPRYERAFIQKLEVYQTMVSVL